MEASAEVGPLLSSLRPEDGNFDVLVCNPPFFGSAEEAARFTKADQKKDDEEPSSDSGA